MKCWRLWTGLMVVALLTWPNAGVSGPVGGRKADFVIIDAGDPGVAKFDCVFTGGERACVIVQGDHKPIVNVGIQIYDQKGNLLAKDDGKGDLAAVVWYPPEDGTYTIQVLNPNAEKNKCFVVVR